MFYLYILKSETRGSYYIGHTANIPERLFYHNQGWSKSTKSGRPWKVVYQEAYPTNSEAQRREVALKREKSSKYIERLIRGVAQLA